MKHAANHFTSSKVREEQYRIYESIPEDVKDSCREEHREELDALKFDEADEEKYRPVRRISGEAYQRAQGDPEWKKARSDGGTVSVRRVDAVAPGMVNGRAKNGQSEC